MFSNIFASLFDRILTILIVLICVQVPVYIAQYIDVLAGAEMEARQSYEKVLNLAEKKGVSVDQFIQGTKARTPSTEDAYDYVEIVASSVQRYKQYQEALYDLRKSSIFLQPVILIRHFDPAIHQAMSFELGFQFTFQTIGFVLAGIVLSMILSYFLNKMTGLFIRRQKKRSS